ncbi:MAG: FlgO family outer membrane protein [Candidatus Bipolaricaulia bacterium]
MSLRMAAGIGVGWFTVVLVSVAAFHPAVAQQQELVIAIVDFENTSGRAEFDQLERTIPESMLTFFAREERVRIVERARLQVAIEEIQLGLGGIVDTRTASEIGRAVGATAIIIGSFSVIGDQIRINARLIDVETGEVITGEQVQGGIRGAQIFELTDELSARVLAKLTGERVEPERLEPPLPPERLEPPPPPPIPPLDAFQGRRDGRVAGARDASLSYIPGGMFFGPLAVAHALLTPVRVPAARMRQIAETPFVYGSAFLEAYRATKRQRRAIYAIVGLPFFFSAGPGCCF